MRVGSQLKSLKWVKKSTELTQWLHNNNNRLSISCIRIIYIGWNPLPSTHDEHGASLMRWDGIDQPHLYTEKDNSDWQWSWMHSAIVLDITNFFKTTLAWTHLNPPHAPLKLNLYQNSRLQSWPYQAKRIGKISFLRSKNKAGGEQLLDRTTHSKIRSTVSYSLERPVDLQLRQQFIWKTLCA